MTLLVCNFRNIELNLHKIIPLILTESESELAVSRAERVEEDKDEQKRVDLHPSLPRYRFLVPLSTFTVVTFSLAASSLLTAATMNNFLPSKRMPPLCIT